MTEINSIELVILALAIFIILYLVKPQFESFKTDISVNKTYTGSNIIYDTIPYNNSSLFYDYILGSPYYYNPLDYWLNPYYYYSLYNPIYTTSNSRSIREPHIKKVRRIRKTRRFH